MIEEKQTMLKSIAKEYTGRKKNSVLILISNEELSRIDENAAKFTNGNRSAWIRYAAAKHKPAHQEVVSIEV